MAGRVKRAAKPTAADLAQAQPAPVLTRELRQALEATLAGVRLGFDLRKPWAMDMAEGLRDRHRTAEIDLLKSIELMSQAFERNGAYREVEFRPLQAGDKPRFESLPDRIGSFERRAYIQGYFANEIQRVIDENEDTALVLPTGLTYHDSKALLAADTDAGATPETWAKPSRIAPIPELYNNRRIDRGHVRAAVEIARVVEAVTSAVSPRGGSLAPGTIGSVNMRDYLPVGMAEVWSMRYVPWSKQQRKEQRYKVRHFHLTLEVVVGGVSVRAARAKFKFGYDRAVELIRAGLEDYAKLMDEVETPTEHDRRSGI